LARDFGEKTRENSYMLRNTETPPIQANFEGSGF
jgi:hypothetical protein